MTICPFFDIGRTVCSYGFIGLIVLFSASVGYTQPALTPAGEVISKLQNKIYILGETSGGKPEEWDKAEQEAVSALQKIAQSSSSSLIQPALGQQTPLMLAAQGGYAPIVEELLKYSNVRENLEAKGPSGTAWQQSMLAIRQALVTCHPTVDSPFALVHRLRRMVQGRG